ncbi:cyclic nucleotide-binding domain-containing protein, partial [Salmonella sp. s51228]|uniref:cyclic nucleotide-binding domain-containing protein n=1 Tax=Salmonella sp. s51228 TaxID=3159652 RepID=UPI0039812DEB
KEDIKTEMTLTTLKTGEYFGEIALLQANPVRTATVTAITKIHLFTLDKDYFIKLIGPLKEIKQKFERANSIVAPILHDPYQRIELNNIHKVGIMGQGAYGTVHLVKIQGVE